MLIDINKIVVKEDRLRKDFGDMSVLTESIRENGLIHPVAINKNYVLLAGERRLRACKMLGWDRIEVNMMDTEDDAQDLAIELDENNTRLNFTGSELAEGIRRQMAIESEKAKERQGERTDIQEIFPRSQSGQARDKAGEAFGISGKQAEKVLFVDDNRDLLDPADFADWDEGKLSTNKAYQKIKAAQQQAERDKRLAEQEADRAKRDLAEAFRDAENLETQNEALRRQLAEKPKPEVIEREVVREVVPADVQRRIKMLENDNRRHNEDYKKLRQRNQELHDELEKAKDALGMDKTMSDVRSDVQFLITSTNQYIRRYGGLTWTVQELEKVDADTREELKKAAMNLATFASALVGSLEGM